MRGRFLAFCLTVIATGAVAQDCPTGPTHPVWHQMGCVFSQDAVDLFANAPDSRFDFDPSRADANDMVWQLATRGDVASVHYQASFETLEPRIIELFERAGLEPLTTNDRGRLHDEAIAGADGDAGAVWAVMNSLDRHVTQQDRHLVYIEASTDFLTYGILDEARFCRWNMTQISDFVKISQVDLTAMDPGAWGKEWPSTPRDCSEGGI